VKRDHRRLILCNGATCPDTLPKSAPKPLRLEYREQPDRNVTISLPDFVRDVYHLPARVLDLLEVASYVFAADRLLPRGRRAAVEYDSWSRLSHFVIKVRDIGFWSRGDVQRKLANALFFLTGDQEYRFSFQSGHSTEPTSLFDSEFFRLPERGSSVVLFSGGLDSLAGTLERLAAHPDEKVCIVSHRSQPGTMLTQKRLAAALQALHPGRVTHYTFDCVLHKRRAAEETQRSRAFLYVSIAYALACALSQTGLYVYENGVTALNFARRQDLLRARASRTTHPKTIRLLSEFLSEVSEAQFTIYSPFSWITKADVIRRLAALKQERLITSAVSCSRTFQKMEREATHCGTCSQCVERRFAAYAAGLDDVDESGLYGLDFIEEKIEGEAKTTVVDFVRQARDFAESNLNQFYSEKTTELVEALDGLKGSSEQTAVEKIWELCRRHGEQVLLAIRRMRETHDNPFGIIPPGSFLHMVSEREYLKEPIKRFVESVCSRLSVALPLAFRRNQPKDEGDLNDKMSAILISEKEVIEREHPAVRFALGHAVPDHSVAGKDVFIESKYIRAHTTPAKVSEGMAADLTKYGKEHYVLFVVYDPGRSIADDAAFRVGFESAGRCTVRVVR
jgi:7-cyano-7-deazaguanine synthase in queuosine biosynthesis